MTPKEYAAKLIGKAFLIIQMADKYSCLTKDEEKYFSVQIAINSVEEMLNNELLTDLLQLPDGSPHKYKAIYQKMWLTDVKNELLKQQNNG